MTKREYIAAHEPVAYYSGLNGVEIYGIEYGIDDYLFCASNCWSGSPRRTPHRLKIHYAADKPYVMLHGYRIPLDECLRV